MCNLYVLKTSVTEIAAWFQVEASRTFNAPEEILPGYPGLVVREEDGQRRLQQMVWGFPLHLKSMKAGSKPKPVNNIADLLKPMWIGLARQPTRRCLIPLTAFAEAEGVPGARTRTWFSVTGHPVFAWAGLWRESAEWGPVYAGLMTDSNAAVQPVHDRMPALLLPEDQDRWLQGDLDDALALQKRVFPEDLIEIRRTTDLWVKRRTDPPQSQVLLL